jgi:nitroreductase
MSISRRGFLKGAGASIVVLGTGGIGWVLTRSPEAALQPWEEAGGVPGDVRLQALSHAILAPNPHNRQPWLARLVGDDSVDIYCQLDRRLPQTDPFDRQITIGLGCFIELYAMAAARLGYAAQVEAFPDGEPQPRLDERAIARVTLRKAKPVADPLWDQVRRRRSNKEVFDTSRPVSNARVAKMVDVARISSSPVQVGFTTEQVHVEGLRELTFSAFEREWQTPRTLQESVDLMRIGKAEINANPDGIDIGGALPDTLNALGLLTRETLVDPKSQAFAQTTSMFRETLFSGMGYVWLATPVNSRRDQLQAGAAWLRLNLAATQAGLGFHPTSQSLQEFPEMETFFRKVHREIGVEAPSRLQMLTRLGYGPQIAPSPRWALETRLVRP